MKYELMKCWITRIFVLIYEYMSLELLLMNRESVVGELYEFLSVQ